MQGRIPALDGWRGLAILLVLIDHLVHGSYRWKLYRAGPHGVTIFFVLSGFLITSKLIEGPVDLKRFYIRRFFRLMPAAWIFLAFLGVFGVLFRPTMSRSDALGCIFFYRNYVGDKQMLTAHFWSLSLEEQFYVVWPCILLLAGIRKSRWIAAIATLACASYRYLRWEHYINVPFDLRTEVRADAILAGCLLALLFEDPSFRSFVERSATFYVVPSIAVLLFCFGRFHSMPPLFEVLSIVALLAATLTHPDSAAARALANPVLVKLGVVSYSLYLWQQFFVSIPGLLGIIILSLGLPLCAIGSYYLIERPGIQLSSRLTGGKRFRKAEWSESNDAALASIESA